MTDFVRGGKALVGIHAATDNGGCRELAKLLGGQFAGHPWGGGGTWAFKLEEPQHVLLAGFQARTPSSRLSTTACTPLFNC